VQDSKLTQYLSIINRTENYEQILFFYNKNKKLVKNFFYGPEYQSDSIINIILEEEPLEIFKVKSWNDDKICDWLKNQSPSIFFSIQKDFSTFLLNKQNYNKKVIDTVYSGIIETWDNKLGKSHVDEIKEHCLKIMPDNFIIFLYNKSPEILDEFMNRKFKLSTDKKDSKYIIVNGAQYLIYKRQRNSLHKVSQIFKPYIDLLKQDVDEKIDFYQKQTPFFEICIRTLAFKSFIPFSGENHENLNTNEQLMLMSAAFSYLENISRNSSNSFGLKKEIDNLHLWCQAVLINGDINIFSRMKQEINEQITNDPTLTKELEQLYLMKTLNLNLIKKLKQHLKIKYKTILLFFFSCLHY